jgi:dUTP pyrophosphatase|tara:strand:- start:965 stop:1423 length:459 start_codon:yes stop_codon:yes gene_type:complete
MLIDYFKLRDSAQDPVRANPSDAGLDVFYCPSETTTGLVIPSGASVVVETGLKFGVPHGFMLEVKNRSSMASKKQLLVGACVIDPGYNGELYVNLHNVSNDDKSIRPGDKIAQVVMIPIIHFRARKLMTDTLYDSPICVSNRNTGGFGSTGD